MTTETMKLALEALEEAHPKPYNESVISHVEAITALRTAIAEAEKQEPVAWLYRDSWGTLKLSQIMPPPIGAFPVYTTPPAAQREPLAWADEIIADLHALYDSEMIKEIDSGDALIRLDAAICAVEEAEERHTTPPAQPAPVQEFVCSTGLCHYKAQRLANALEEKPDSDGHCRQAAAELRRLEEAHDWQYKMAGERLRRIEKLERINAQLLEALEEAADDIESWGAYASGYFQTKHDLLGSVNKARAAIAAAKGEA